MTTGTWAGTFARNQGSTWSKCSCEITTAVGSNRSSFKRWELSGYGNQEPWNAPSGENHGSSSRVASAVFNFNPACPSDVTSMSRELMRILFDLPTHGLSDPT